MNTDDKDWNVEMKIVCPKCQSENVTAVTGMFRCMECEHYFQPPVKPPVLAAAESPSFRIKPFWAIVLIGAIIGILIIHKMRSQIKSFNDELDKQAYWAGNRPENLDYNQCCNQTEELLLEECSNEVVGLTRIIDHHIFDLSTNAGSSDYTYEVTNWQGEATVEHINSVGGIDRTNLYFVFTYIPNPASTGGRFLACELDYKKLDAQDQANFQRQLDRASQ